MLMIYMRCRLSSGLLDSGFSKREPTMYDDIVVDSVPYCNNRFLSL